MSFWEVFLDKKYLKRLELDLPPGRFFYWENMKEFDLWRRQIDPMSTKSRIKVDSTYQPGFNQRKFIVYPAYVGRARLIHKIELPLEVLQELWRENWSDQ